MRLPDPSPEEKLAGDMLMLTTGFMMVAAAIWLAIFARLGRGFSLAIPAGFLGLSALTILLDYRYRRPVLAMAQLALILFTPFALQWSVGNFVSAAGVSLWGLIAPIGAVTILGTRQSTPWFFAWFFMTAMAGTFDYLLAGESQRVDARATALFFVVNFTMMSVMVFGLLWFFARGKQRLREEVEAEKERGDRLLLNILPPGIADQLKRGDGNIAHRHPEVTVMFADIVAFTRIASEHSPEATVQILNDVFSLFDDIADRHGVEKVKTVGDAYMAAAGLSPHGGTATPVAVAGMAEEMLRAVADYRKNTGEAIELRIGIATGPVVAGVIGKKKFIYDLWGDTVNVASRLASDARPGSIEIDASTHAGLAGRFRFEEREAELKGKGTMKVFRTQSATAD